MEAGISNHIWTVGELIALLPKPTVRASSTEREMVIKALNG
jgi:hypothetical protein